jgi:hypothetical protein
MQKNEQSAAEWELYESAVRYVAEHPEIITALNLRDVEEMMSAQ